MKWNIICDSGCDLFALEKENKDIAYKSVPFYITIEDKGFNDNETLDTEAMIKAMKESKEASSTACPSPGSWKEEMNSGENNICITVSKNLSGSYASAVVASMSMCEENPGTNAAVVDGCATGPASVLVVRKITELIENGESFESVVEKAQEYAINVNTVFTLSCFDNLVKSGRVSKLAGMLAASLNFWGVGLEVDGQISVHAKVRGKKKAIASMLELISKKGFNDGNVVISHCINEPLALTMKEEIEKINPDAKITIMKARGLNSFYADREGIIISY